MKIEQRTYNYVKTFTAKNHIELQWKINHFFEAKDMACEPVNIIHTQFFPAKGGWHCLVFYKK